MKEEEIKQLFRRNSDCYADTHEQDSFGNLVEGEVIMAMTEEAFIKAMQEYAEDKGSCPMCESLNKVWGDEDDYSDTEPKKAKEEQPKK